jgi:hypothetical protein
VTTPDGWPALLADPAYDIAARLTTSLPERQYLEGRADAARTNG